MLEKWTWLQNAETSSKQNEPLRKLGMTHLFEQYPGWDLNPHDFKGHRILSPACLPFHHPGNSVINTSKLIFVLKMVHFNKKSLQFCRLLGAENETRTRDFNLGKVALYQLSYFRNLYL